MFYGIIVLMFFFDNKKHHRPHIHAQYGEYEVIIAIDDGEVLGSWFRHGLRYTGTSWRLTGDWLSKGSSRSRLSH